MLGLKRGTVRLCMHQKEWETEAQRTIFVLRDILSESARAIEHVGSTAVCSIQAKPILDIAVAAEDFSAVLAKTDVLERAGFYYRPKAGQPDELLFACGSYYQGLGDEQTHFIHVVSAGGAAWRNYIAFRDSLNKNIEVARAYEALKLSLATASDSREAYTKGKQAFIEHILHRALADGGLEK